MSRAPGVLAGLAIAAVAAVAAPRQTAPAQAPFRATTDLVTVEVTVRSGSTPVAGLTAVDFTLLDNGVPQTIDSVSMEAVPLDLSLLVDANEDVADDLPGLSDQVRRMAALVRPADRVRVMTVNDGVADLVPAAPAGTAELPAPLSPRGLSSAHDGLVAALLRPVEPHRPHLIVALTNGIDALSAVDATAVRDVARRSRATLHIVQVDVAMFAPGIYLSGRERLDRHRCAASSLCSPTRRFWIPYDDHDFETLREAAEATGGALHLPGLFSDRTALAIFERIFADHQRSYLLRYTPQGVGRAGWHDLSVTLPAFPGYTVRARRGYAIDSPADAPPAPADEATALAAAYDHDDAATFAGRLRRAPRLADLVDDVREAGPLFPAAPKREAAFVIELAEAALHSTERSAREAGHRLLGAHVRLVRHPLWPDAFERFWLWAAIALLHGANDPDAASAWTDRALARFPDEPRFLLSRAFVEDQRRARAPLQDAQVTAIAAAYDEAMAADDTRAEARLRKGWLLARAGRDADALALLDAATGTTDAGIGYLRELYRGRVLARLNRQDDAIAAYRAALAIVPEAQSARVALMTALLAQGDRAGAGALAEAVQTARTEAWDPAWSYWIGDYRLYPDIVRRLREQTR